MITERALHNECLGLAQDLILEARQAATEGDHSFSMSDRVHETVDGHEWIIYHGKAQMVCMAATFGEVCQAEMDLQDMGYTTDGQDFDFWKIQAVTAFQIMHNKITEAIFDINEEAWS